MRNPKRTSATAAALMIGVALVGLITVFAASARTSVNAAIDQLDEGRLRRSRRAGFGQGSIPLDAEQLAGGAARGHVGVGHPQRSGRDRRLGHPGHRRRPGRTIDSLFDLEPKQGTISELERRRHRGPRQHGERQRLEARQTRPGHVRADRRAAVHGRVDLHSSRAFTELRDHARRLRAELHRPARLPGLREHRRAASRRQNTRRDRAGDEAVPRRRRSRTATSSRPTQAAQINQFLNLVYVLLFFAIIIALFGIANTLGAVDHRATRELGLLRAVGMTRRQVRSSVRWESVIIALLGTLLGLVIGVVFGWAMVKALTDEGIDKFSHRAGAARCSSWSSPRSSASSPRRGPRAGRPSSTCWPSISS